MVSIERVCRVIDRDRPSTRATQLAAYPDTPCILAPTFLEYVAARFVLSGATVVHAGVRLSRFYAPPGERAFVVCGLAGALGAASSPGTVVIPDQVGLPDGRIIECDADLTGALRVAAQSLHLPIECGRLLTSPELVTGPDREFWARRGFVAADMETGLLGGRGLRVATVRVLLDTPSRDISPEWIRPTRSIASPSLWLQLLWLAWSAPRHAVRAASVVQEALLHNTVVDG